MMTKAKPFFEVFPTLNISGTLHDKLEQAKVERVSATRQKDRLTVYLYSTRHERGHMGGGEGNQGTAVSPRVDAGPDF